MRRSFVPPLFTVAALGGLAGAYLAFGIQESDGSDASEALTGSTAWLTWKVVAALTLVVFVGLLIGAARTLGDRVEWGISASPRRVGWYLTWPTVAVVVLVALTWGDSAPDLPIEGLGYRTRAILYVGLIAAIPWLALVWLAHVECAELRDRLVADRSKQATAAARSAARKRTLRRRRAAVHRSNASFNASEATPWRFGGSAGGTNTVDGKDLRLILLLWRLLIACVSAFALAVVAVILTTGALRTAFLEANPDSNEFPPSDVLLYGALFALALSLITVPLVAAWRSCAIAFVNSAYPLPVDGIPTEPWETGKGRLEQVLHLDVSLLRNPLTALTVFVPLVTATFAAFVPQLGTS